MPPFPVREEESSTKGARRRYPSSECRLPLTRTGTDRGRSECRTLNVRTPFGSGHSWWKSSDERRSIRPQQTYVDGNPLSRNLAGGALQTPGGDREAPRTEAGHRDRDGDGTAALAMSFKYLPPGRQAADLEAMTKCGSLAGWSCPTTGPAEGFRSTVRTSTGSSWAGPTTSPLSMPPDWGAVLAIASPFHSRQVKAAYRARSKAGGPFHN